MLFEIFDSFLLIFKENSDDSFITQICELILEKAEGTKTFCLNYINDDYPPKKIKHILMKEQENTLLSYIYTMWNATFRDICSKLLISFVMKTFVIIHKSSPMPWESLLEYLGYKQTQYFLCYGLLVKM